MHVAADQVSKLLKDCGATVGKEELDAMIKSVSGKKLHELVASGSKQLATVATPGRTIF